MAVRYMSGILDQFEENIGLLTNMSSLSGTLVRAPQRYLPEKAPDSGMDGKFFLNIEALDPKQRYWGTGAEAITDGIVTVQTSYVRGGGDAGGAARGGDRATVMRHAADDMQRIADVCENDANYNPNVTGIRAVTYLGASRVHDLDRAEVWESRFRVEWRSDLALTPVITPSGGGVTLLAIPGSFSSTNEGGGEDVIGYPLAVNWDDFSFTRVRIRLLGWVYVSDGEGTYRVRRGGTKGSADGTVVVEMTTDGTSEDLVTEVGDAFNNPGGEDLLQVTFENDTTDEVAYIDGIGVAILSGGS